MARKIIGMFIINTIQSFFSQCEGYLEALLPKKMASSFCVTHNTFNKIYMRRQQILFENNTAQYGAPT